MTVSAQNADIATPMVGDDLYIIGHGISTTNVINPGDWVVFSGTGIAAAEDAQAYWKASGAGIALDANPTYDQHGRTVVNSAVAVATRGLFRVSAAYSGHALNGVLVFPATTGSGVNAPSGVTGLGATWNTAVPVTVSGATASVPVKGVGQLIASYPANGPAGTGHLDIRIWPRNADYY